MFCLEERELELDEYANPSKDVLPAGPVGLFVGSELCAACAANYKVPWLAVLMSHFVIL